MIPYSFLDLAHVNEGQAIGQTFKNSEKIAQAAEELGFTRYWFAEHHNAKSVASSATSVLIGHIAGKTSKIRVGSGGIMLPNHSPLVIAEHFGTLAELYPDRIDLGLGRAPGTDQNTARYINPNFIENSQKFPERVQELQLLLSDNNQSRIHAYPGEGTNVPLWILGSSTDSAYLAAKLGLPYAFASHFAPAQLVPAFDIYVNNSLQNGYSPKKAAAINVIIAETDEKAQKIATTMYQTFLGLVRNNRYFLKPPIESMDGVWSPEEEMHVKKMLSCSFIGSKETVSNNLNQFIKDLKPDELIITASAYHLADKLYSIKHFAEVMNERQD